VSALTAAKLGTIQNMRFVCWPSELAFGSTTAISAEAAVAV
jgi:hypothetical protein